MLLFANCKKETIAKTELKTVIIQPYAGFSTTKADSLAKEIEYFYKIKVKIAIAKKLPQNAIVTIKSPRYRADSIIRIQEREIIKSTNYILGLTNQDISVTKKESDGSIKKPEWKYNDFGVMGLAFCPGKSCVISSFRLKNKNKELEFSRLKKVVIHEFGHNLGLPHCPNLHCVMTSANEKITTIDQEKMELCAKCKAKIKLEN